jgi:dihydrofolate synthase/folylpolyglutamate synthase
VVPAPGSLTDRTAALAEVEDYFFGELPPMQAGVMSGHGAGVRRAAHLLRQLGDPQEDLRIVHVAGTAGKGSVCAFVTAVLEAHGFSVGRYLSPHAHSILERFAVHGRPVDAELLAPVLVDVRELERGSRNGPDGASSMFEVATVIAFELFRREKADYAVIETGLGGLHDATNVVRRNDKLAVLTSIGLDHVDILGSTVGAVAGQKAGILPEGGQAVAVGSGPEAEQVVRAEATRRGCRLELQAASDLAAVLPESIRLGLPGQHQRVNAGLALRAVAALAERDGWALRADRIAEGLAAAGLPGRFERRWFQGHPLVLDGAHNPMKLDALIQAVREEFPGQRPVYVLGVKPDKDLPEILRLVSGAARRVIATEFDPQDAVRAVPVQEIAATARREGLPRVEVHPDPADALSRAVQTSSIGVPIMVTGSFHTVAAAGRRADRIRPPT